MNIKTLSQPALAVIDSYVNFRFGSAVCSVPYFNNRTVKARAALRAVAGKGSPEEIREEVETIVLRNHINDAALADESLKKLLADANLGVDCSAFAYYVLNAENAERTKTSLKNHLSFVNCTGVIGKMRCALRPIENCDVATLADNANSRVVSVSDVVPGDMITIMHGPEGMERDHILVIHQVEYQNSVPVKIHYSHAVAYPEDGVYGTGIRQGYIEITDPHTSLLDGHWAENGKEGVDNRIYARALKSQTELRRLNWF